MIITTMVVVMARKVIRVILKMQIKEKNSNLIKTMIKIYLDIL